MNLLPSSAMDAIVRHDWSVHGKRKQPNRTRFYRYLLPAGHDMEVHTVACKADRCGFVTVKEVVRCSVDESFTFVKDLACVPIAGYVVDWSPEKLGRSRSWSYGGRWASEAWTPSGKWMLRCDVINPEALTRHDRFKYCAWTPECDEIVKWLKVYAKHPRIELLAKSGLGRLGQAASFVKQLERDKALARLILENAEAIRQFRYGTDVIRKAYSRGVSLADASRSISDRREFRGMQLPLEIDASKALAYIDRKGGKRWEYCAYVRHMKTLGADLRDTKNAFPRCFKQRQQIAADRIAEIERRKKADLMRSTDESIGKIADRFAHLERARAFRVLLPRRSDDLVTEGKRLHNCLGDGHYAARIARGESVIAFVRQVERPSVPWVAVEFSPERKQVLQCYAAKNSRPPAPVVQFVNRLFRRAVA